MRRAGFYVLVTQLLIVMSIGVWYSWRRHHDPMVWTTAEEYPFGGPQKRYLPLNLHADACGLNRKDASETWTGMMDEKTNLATYHTVYTVKLVAEAGKLVAVHQDKGPGPAEYVTVSSDRPCSLANVGGDARLFLPESVESPFPLKPGQQLWALVSVPGSGLPRPVAAAVSDATGWHVLKTP
jgi:hypothetical protein